MVADAISRLQSDHMDESFMNDYVLECYVEYVECTLSVDTVNSFEGDAPCKSTIDDLMRERHKDASCRILKNLIDDNDSLYIIDNKGVYQDVHNYMVLHIA